MTRLFIHRTTVCLCLLGVATACSSQPDAAGSQAATTPASVARKSAPAANEYPVLTLTPWTEELPVDYPAVLQEDAKTGSMQAVYSVSKRAVRAVEWHWLDSAVLDLMWQMSNVQLVFADGTVYDQRGHVSKANEQAAANARSVAVQATFANPDGRLQSGEQVLVRLPLKLPQALLVPGEATYREQGRRRVYVVGPDNRVVSTEIEVLPLRTAPNLVVIKGLKAGDRIVAQNVRSLQDGKLIVPRLVAEPQAPTAAVR